MKYILIVTLLIFISCQTNEKRVIASHNEILTPVLDSFTTVLSVNPKSLPIVTLSCNIVNDTIIFNLINAYPDLDVAKYHGYTELNGFRIFSLGEPIPDSFFKVREQGEIPDDIKVRKNIIYRNKDLVIANTEPLVWSLHFKDKQVIKCYPINICSLL